ncbi:unnamed protein product [Polarella glacialis]|uniref:GH18 domain-containing protein n=1 Tax=Polarella glacialis TaxID=89957 RepID=A0A813I022_POLGL|nr:unnamed protein product [Polarella glacialis]
MGRPCVIFLTSCSVDSEDVGLLQGPQRFKSVSLTTDRGGSEVGKQGRQRGGKGSTTTTTTTTYKLASTMTTQSDVLGYYARTGSNGTTVPYHANMGVCVSGYEEVATAISQCSSSRRHLVGTKYLSIGGVSYPGLITADRLTAVGAATASIWDAGYEGVIFDIEEVSGSTDEINNALDAAVAALKAAGLAAAVTTSHSCPYSCSGCDGSALVASWVKNADIGILSPQLYTTANGTGTEVAHVNLTPTAGCPWSLYANARASVAPSMPKASDYSAMAVALFATEGVTTGGTIVWATASRSRGCSSCSGWECCYNAVWAVPCSFIKTDQSTCTSEGGNWCC